MLWCLAGLFAGIIIAAVFGGDMWDCIVVGMIFGIAGAFLGAWIDEKRNPENGS